jgi:hypothetical protein
MLFLIRKIKEATTYFNKTVNSKEFGSTDKYYLGFMAYEGGTTIKKQRYLRRSFK